jgi:hypothetical protein
MKMKLKTSTVVWLFFFGVSVASLIGQIFGKPQPGETNRGGVFAAGLVIAFFFAFLAYRSQSKHKAADKMQRAANPQANQIEEVDTSPNVLVKENIPKRPGDFTVRVSDQKNSLKRNEISREESDELRDREEQMDSSSSEIKKLLVSCANCHEPLLATDVAYCSKCGEKIT